MKYFKNCVITGQNRIAFNLQKWKFCNGTDIQPKRQTNTHTKIRSICLCFFNICIGLALKILYVPQNYWPYLGFRNRDILTTFDQDNSLNWKYYPEEFPILSSTVYQDNGVGCTINDTRVQSHVPFIYPELCARCIVPPW